MYKDKKVIHLVARDSKCGIGKDNSLMWNIPEDMKFFRESTLGHVCLVGRKTAESFPKPLSRRIVLEVTRYPHKTGFGVNRKSNVVTYLDEAVHVSEEFLNTDKIFIIGGEMLYNSTFDIADELWVTEVGGDFGADKFYSIPEDFRLSSWSDWCYTPKTVNHDVIKYRFTTYLKK